MLPAIRTDNRWMNQFNTFGTAADPVTRTIFGFSQRVERTELESLYRHDWVARAVVENLANDATREWLQVRADDDGNAVDVDVMNDLLTSLHVKERINEAMILSRLYGGSVIILGAYDGQQLVEPLNEERVNWFEFLLVLDRWQMFPRAWYRDPSHPMFGKPSHYLVQPLVQGASTVTNFVIHESRLLRFDGNFLPVRLRLRNIGWGDSALEVVYEALRQYGISTQSGAALMEDFVLKIYKMDDLPEKLGSGQLELVTQRMQLAAGQMAMHGMTVIGPNDELTREGQPVGGLFRIMEQFVEYIAGASGQPKVRLFGSQKSVLGSGAGDTEMRTWYDKVRAFQKNDLDEKVHKLLRIKAKAEGLPTEGWSLDWKPLWQMDDVTKSQVATNWSQAHANWIGLGVLTEQEVADSVFGGDEINFDNIQLDHDLRAQLAQEPDAGSLEDLDGRMVELESGVEPIEGPPGLEE